MALGATVHGRIIRLDGVEECDDADQTADPRRRVHRAAELRAVEDYADDLAWFQGDSQIDIWNPDGPLAEVKSAVREYKAGRPGRFEFREQQHRRVLETGSTYHLYVIIDIGPRAFLTLASMPIKPRFVEELVISRRRWITSDRGDRYIRASHKQIPELMAEHPAVAISQADFGAFDGDLELHDWAERILQREPLSAD